MSKEFKSPREALRDYYKDYNGECSYNELFNILGGRTPCECIKEICKECIAEGLRVSQCPVTQCPLYNYRGGHNPNRKNTGNKHPNTKKPL